MKSNFSEIAPLLSLLFLLASAAASTAVHAQKNTATPLSHEPKKEVKKMETFGHQLRVRDSKNETKTFHLGQPRTVSREVTFYPETKSVNGFYLPRIESTTFQYKDQFVGDVQKGGSCNVDILRYVPHGLTHIETSAHILSWDERAVTLKDIPPQNLCGLVYLMDLTHLEAKPGQSIDRRDIEARIKKITLPITMLALKTRASLLPQDTDFSGKDYLYLHPEAAQAIHDFKPRLHCLILDLPSIDRENDGGQLLAHRYFFGLPRKAHQWVDKEKRTLVELAWFSDLKEGYYYAVITPPSFQSNAVSTGIFFHPLIESDESVSIPKKNT
ncbi:cyclase family protein [Acidobacteriota bacterium]